MSATFFGRPGPSGADCEASGFSNAVVLPAGARIAITAGQAGIDLKTGKLVTSSPAAQIEAAFDCLDVALKSAGVPGGLAGAYKVNSYLTKPTEHDSIMMDIWRRRYPGHRPIWASVGAHKMVLEDMVIELQAEGLVPAPGSKM